MPAYTVTCPECRASLKSSRPIAPGTPLECPKCQVMFAAPAAKPKARPRAEVIDDVEVVDDVEVIDDVEVLDDVEVVDDAPARPRAKTAASPAPKRAVNAGIEVVDEDEDDEDDRPRKKFKAKKSNKGGNGLVIALAALGLVVVLGGGAGLAWWLLSGGGEEPLAYLPADTPIVAGVNLGALSREIPSLGQQIDQAVTQMNASGNFRDEAGIEPREMFDQVVVGARAEGQRPIFTIVTLSSRPFDRSKLTAGEKKGFTKKSGYGQTYFEQTQAGMTFRGFYPNKRNWVVTTLADAQVDPVFRSDGKTIKLAGPLAAQVAKLRTNHFWLVAKMEDSLKQQIPGGGAPGAGMPAAQALTDAMQQAKAVAVWATVSGGKVDLHAGLECADAGTAEQTVAKLQTEVPKVLPVAGMFMSEAPAPVKAAFEEIKASLKFAANGTMAETSFQFSVANLEALVGQAGQMFGGPGGPQPPGGPPAGMPGRGRRGPGGR